MTSKGTANVVLVYTGGWACDFSWLGTAGDGEFGGTSEAVVEVADASAGR